jgi:hypothetical protein
MVRKYTVLGEVEVTMKQLCFWVLGPLTTISVLVGKVPPEKM